MEHDSRANFKPTRWTIIDSLRDGDESIRAKALEDLAGQYWPPVYSHLRRSGKSREEAADLTQSFFADVVFKRRLFERADQKSFRLRTFILHALKNFLVDNHRRRSKDASTLALSFDQIGEEEEIRSRWTSQSTNSAEGDPAADFHRRWALVVLREALSRCEDSLKNSGRECDWKLFETWVVEPAMFDSRRRAISELAKSLGMASYTDAIVSLRSIRKKLSSVYIPQVLAETNSSPTELDDEYQIILALLP